jgi:hypothetical protein
MANRAERRDQRRPAVLVGRVAHRFGPEVVVDVDLRT